MSHQSTPTGELLRDYWSEPGLAEELDERTTTVADWRRRGSGPPATKIGRRWFYRKTAVRQWLLEREHSRQGELAFGADDQEGQP